MKYWKLLSYKKECYDFLRCLNKIFVVEVYNKRINSFNLEVRKSYNKLFSESFAPTINLLQGGGSQLIRE